LLKALDQVAEPVIHCCHSVDHILCRTFCPF
jgi:hypothetical protein